MDSEQEKQIIKLIQKRAEETGGCNIALTAQEVLFYKPSISQQELIADKIIRSEAFLKSKIENEWVIYINPDYKEPLLEISSEKKLSFIHYLIGLIIALVIFFARMFFEQPIPPKGNPKILKPSDFSDTTIPVWEKPIKFDTTFRKKH